MNFSFHSQNLGQWQLARGVHGPGWAAPRTRGITFHIAQDMAQSQAQSIYRLPETQSQVQEQVLVGLPSARLVYIEGRAWTIPGPV